jgi:hypothetical protein
MTDLQLRRSARRTWALGTARLLALATVAAWVGSALGQAPDVLLPETPAAETPGAEAPAAEPVLPPAEAAPVKELPIDEEQEANRIRNLGEIKAMLLAARFADAGERERFDAYFERYALPRWTYQVNAPLLPAFRREMQQLLWFGKTGEPHDRLNELILTVLGPVMAGTDLANPAAKENYHVATRVNAALMIGELNAVEPAPTAPPSPLSAALTLLIRTAQDQDSPDAVRVAALVGVSRHVQLWRAGGGSLPPAATAVQNLVLGILAESAPPEGRTPEGHSWMRAQAMAILGELAPPAATPVPPLGNAPLAKVLADVAADSAVPLPTRTRAAETLGRLNYSGATGLNPSELSLAIGRAALDACDAEAGSVSRRRLKARLAAAWFGLMGEEWRPTGQPTPGAVAALGTAPPHDSLVAAVQGVLHQMLTMLDDRKIDDFMLATAVAPLRDALAQMVGKQP